VGFLKCPLKTWIFEKEVILVRMDLEHMEIILGLFIRLIVSF